MRRKYFYFLLVLMMVVLLAITFGKAKAAGSVTGADMIALINSWRAGYWSNALIEDVALDSCAQATADEMARINAGDHLSRLGYSGASTRCSENGFGGGSTVFVTENWAAHYNMTIDILAGYWSDSAHMLPATMQQYCYVGVGIATADNGNVYYILQAGAISGDSSCSSSSTSSGSTSVNPDNNQGIGNYVVLFGTSTPDSDGTIYHVVKANDTLYTIAVNYNVTIDQIKTLNQLTSNDIYVGNTLKISLKPTPTITPTRTATMMMPTRTPTLVPATPRPVHSLTPTPDPDSISGFPKLDRQWLGLALLILGAAGFFVVFYAFFLKPMRKK